MWRRIANWHRRWEDGYLALFARPARAQAAPGQASARYRNAALALDTLSSVERQQLHAFSLAYRGARGYALLGRLAVAFSLVGALLRLAFPATGWIAAIAAANAAGFALAFGICGAWFNYRKLVLRKWHFLARMARNALLATLLLWAIFLCFSDLSPPEILGRLPRMLAMMAGIGLMIAVPMLAVGVLRNRQHEALTAQLERDAERERLARALSESQLRLLRAQIEPHFLFNTLGAVQQLAQQGAPRAAELTADLIAFLRASLGDMRADQSSLDAEFKLVGSYLKVMQVRLGEGRLRFTLALPPALAPLRMPGMILLTLAENAIKHGIEPALRGGEIALSASVQDGVLHLRVADSGVGMGATPGSGMGLENVRHRLRLAYGDDAVLTLEDADPGVVAAIAIAHPEAVQ